MHLARLAPILFLLIASGCTSNARLAEQGRRGFRQQGLASWYGPGFHGKLTANGEVYDMHALTAAHKQLPFDTVVKVVNRDNGRSVRVRINDRGPFVHGRIIDLSRTAAERIGLVESGVARVTLTVVETGSGKYAPRDRPSAWLIQAGAFSDRRKAKDHLRDVQDVDRRARLSVDGSLSRILIGPMRSEKEAKRVLASLAKAGIDAILRRAPTG